MSYKGEMGKKKEIRKGKEKKKWERENSYPLFGEV